MQIVNHGIDKTLVEKFKLETKELFDLPIEEKKKYWQTSNEVEGFGQAFVVSEDQKLDWADMFFVSVLPKYMRKPNLIPMLPLPYRFLFLLSFTNISNTSVLKYLQLILIFYMRTYYYQLQV